MTHASVDESLQVLANVQRRRVLQFLRRQRSREASLDELTAHLRSYPDAPADARIRGRDRLRVMLVQTYLPKLSAHGIVDWDRERERVRYRPDDVVEAVLDALAEGSVLAEA